MNPLIGHIVTGVDLAVGGGGIRFHLDDGTDVIARADGDCCSHTWIEEVQGIEQLIGGRVTTVEEVGGSAPDRDGTKSYVRYYGCKITTDKGYALIDYRNESNGYYGGNLVWPDEYFYGGVYGQNGKIDEWRPLVP